MISASGLEARLKQYAQSPKGKKRIKQYLEQRRADGNPLASGKRLVSMVSMEEAAKLLIAVIQKHIPDSIANVGNTLNNSSPIKRKDGSFEVKVAFDAGVLHRESLYYDEYDGIDNIVALLNNGYHARNHVYGWWDGHKDTPRNPYVDTDSWIRSKKDREALNFMQAAVAEFNSSYGEKYDVTAMLGDNYKTQ